MAQEHKDLVFFESRIGNSFSGYGVFTQMLRKLVDNEMSVLHIGCWYYRNLVTDIPNQYLNVKPLIPTLLAIAEKYQHLTEIYGELLTLQEILQEIEMIARERQNDGFSLVSFLKTDGRDVKRDTNTCVLIRSRLIETLKALAVVVKKCFNWLDFPDSFSVEVNMPTDDRPCHTSEGVASKGIVHFQEKNQRYIPVVPKKKIVGT